MTRTNPVDDAVAKLIVELAFIVPRGTDWGHDSAVGRAVDDFRATVYQAGASAHLERIASLEAALDTAIKKIDNVPTWSELNDLGEWLKCVRDGRSHAS
jgi:hypothetical protein